MAARGLAAENAPRPSIVLMMSDDQAWGETGYIGHPYLKTPVLDEMASSVLRPTEDIED
jgi:arylsulfatase A-like enzyme